MNKWASRKEHYHHKNNLRNLRNIKNGDRVRKLLRDSIEADVMERQITYFDKV